MLRPRGVFAACLAAIALTLIGGYASGTAGADDDDYDWGYRKGATPYSQGQLSYLSPREICIGVLKVFLDLAPNKNRDADDAMDGCMDGVRGR